MTFDDILVKLLEHEGGYVNHPRDPGGETNLGVTRKSWEEYIGHRAKEDAIRNLTANDVREFYRRKYWDKIRGDSMNPAIAYCVFDAAVNSGPGRASKWLQEAVGASPDGVVGPNTLRMVEAASAASVINKICDIRLEFLQSLPTFDAFGKGWTRRVGEVRQSALSFLNS